MPTHIRSSFDCDWGDPGAATEYQGHTNLREEAQRFHFSDLANLTVNIIPMDRGFSMVQVETQNGFSTSNAIRSNGDIAMADLRDIARLSADRMSQACRPSLEAGIMEKLVEENVRARERHLLDRKRHVTVMLDEASRQISDLGYWGTFMHSRDLVWGSMFGENEKPDKAEPIAALGAYPKIIEGAPFTAELLADTMRLWEESDRLSHCLYKSYSAAIRDGQYMAWHINGGKSKSGCTLGLRRKARGRKKFHPWILDQLKGNKNSDPRDGDMSKFCEHVIWCVNQVKP